jgi:hypothetical protein
MSWTGGRRYLTFSYDDTEHASCLDISPSLEDARELAPRGATYRYDVTPESELTNETFIEVRGGCLRRQQK